MRELSVDVIKNDCGCILKNKFVRGTLLFVVSSVVTFKVLKKYQRCQRRKKYPKDVVILHQFPGGFRAPSVSPFALKLETWLRMANIPYQNEFGYGTSAKGKIPWITYNGEDIADSQFCIEFLSKKFNIDFSKEFNPVENGAARAFMKMTEESLFWVHELNMIVHEIDGEAVGFPSFLIRLFSFKINKRAKCQGYGLHSKDEINKIGRDDLKAINDYIGDKKFLLGDKVCNADAALFGLLVQPYVHSRGALNKYMKDECGNIIRYLGSIKDLYWPDWNERCKEKSLL